MVTQPAIAFTPEQIEQAKQETHDVLLAGVQAEGAVVVDGVRWRINSGQRAREDLALIYPRGSAPVNGPAAGQADLVEAYWRTLDEHPEATLVIACVLVIPPGHITVNTNEATRVPDSPILHLDTDPTLAAEAPYACLGCSGSGVRSIVITDMTTERPCIACDGTGRRYCAVTRCVVSGPHEDHLDGYGGLV